MVKKLEKLNLRMVYYTYIYVYNFLGKRYTRMLYRIYLRVSYTYKLVFIRVINDHRGLVDRAYVVKQIVEKFN